MPDEGVGSHKKKPGAQVADSEVSKVDATLILTEDSLSWDLTAE